MRTRPSASDRRSAGAQSPQRGPPARPRWSAAAPSGCQGRRGVADHPSACCAMQPSQACPRPCKTQAHPPAGTRRRDGANASDFLLPQQACDPVNRTHRHNLAASDAPSSRRRGRSCKNLANVCRGNGRGAIYASDPAASPAPLPSAACAAARRAIGTRNGEHET